MSIIADADEAPPPRLWKVTGKAGKALSGTGQWRKNRWRTVRGELVPCRNGLHLCCDQDLIHWLGPVIWWAEIDGEWIADGNKIVARRARVTERVTGWNDRSARLFAADCVERVLPLFERERPADSRPRDCLAVSRRFADGDATGDELAAAWDAAWAAAGDAAGAAAWAAARAAAQAAAWVAAEAAAWDAAQAAAWVAAEAAAWDAAEAATWAAARVAERKWQTEHLMRVLYGRH